MSAAPDLETGHWNRHRAVVWSSTGMFATGLYFGLQHSDWVDGLGYLTYAAFLLILPVVTLLMSLKFWAGYFLSRLTRTDALYWRAMNIFDGALVAFGFTAGFFMGYAYHVTRALQAPLFWIGAPVLLFLMLAAVGEAKNRKVYGPRGRILFQGGSPVIPPSRPSNTAVEPAAQNGPAPIFPVSHPKNGLEGLAGMDDLKSEIRNAIAPFARYQAERQPGLLSDRNGILLYGPPGNGKTAFAEAIAGELGLRFMKLSVSDLVTKWVNGTPEILAAAFKQAQQEPTVLFLDEFDAIASSRDAANMHHEDRKAVNALLPLIDEARRQKVVLMAATNFPDQLDSAIARDGRFDFRIEVPRPDLPARVGIIKALCKQYGVVADATLVEKVAALWERRSVSFIDGTIKRLRDNGLGSGSRSATVDEFKRAAREVSRRTSALPRDCPALSELVLPAAVRIEAQSLLHRLRHWETIADRGGEVPSGVLLYGPPGTGKTLFVKALARELGDWHVFEVNTTDVIQDPRKFRTLVELAADYRPAFVFLDEADELLRDRSMSPAASATNEILKTMDGMMGRVPELVFIAATNNPDAIDAAATRGGRFAEKILMPRLSGDDLVSFLAAEFRKHPNVAFAADVSPASLTELFGSIAPADALSVLRKAISYTLTDSALRDVTREDIHLAMKAVLSRAVQPTRLSQFH
jgi:transitional endoplasmic reticulum ATPase